MLFFKLFASKNMRAKTKPGRTKIFSSVLSNFQLVFLLPSEVKKTKKNQEACCELFRVTYFQFLQLWGNKHDSLLMLVISRTIYANAGNKTKTLSRKHHLKIQRKLLTSVFLALLTGVPLSSLKLQILRLFRARNSLTIRQLLSVDSLENAYVT